MSGTKMTTNEKLHPDGLSVDATPICNRLEEEGFTKIDDFHRLLERAWRGTQLHAFMLADIASETQ